MEGIDLYGLGMNLACFAGVIPTREKIETFEEFVKEQEMDLGINFKMVTGGNSGNIPMLINEPTKGRIDNLRIGEGILLGLETAYRQPIPGTYQDAFKIEAQVIESKIKPSVPYGKITQNAYGETPHFEDKGELRRVIVALGRQDTILEDLLVIDNDLEMIGGSSDHIVLHDSRSSYSVGDIVSFIPSYGALVAAFTSPYIEKVYE
jgi:predicted amino acid racemase